MRESTLLLNVTPSGFEFVAIMNTMMRAGVQKAKTRVGHNFQAEFPDCHEGKFRSLVYALLLGDPTVTTLCSSASRETQTRVHFREMLKYMTS